MMKFCIIAFEKYRIGHGGWTMKNVVYGPFADKTHAIQLVTTELKGVPNNNDDVYYNSNIGGDCYLKYEIHMLDTKYEHVGPLIGLAESEKAPSA